MSDDFKEQMKRLRELRDSLSKSMEKLNAEESLQPNSNPDSVVNSLPKIMDQPNLYELFLKILVQQNEFHERLLNKVDEIIVALKK